MLCLRTLFHPIKGEQPYYVPIYKRRVKTPRLKDLTQLDCPRHWAIFYMDIRTQSGELYKATSLESIRHALNRHLKGPPHPTKFDIISGAEFNDANECFKTAMAEIKASGKGTVDHYLVINNVDLSKLYNSVEFFPTTLCGLANRVQMNVRLYFCRRACENMEKMKTTTFASRNTLTLSRSM